MLADQADITFAQFVLLTPFPGTVDFEKWAAEENRRGTNVDGVPVTQHWLIPEDRRPNVYTEHPTMSLEDIRIGTQRAWDRFYSWPRVWARWLGTLCQRLLLARPMPHLAVPGERLEPAVR